MSLDRSLYALELDTCCMPALYTFRLIDGTACRGALFENRYSICMSRSEHGQSVVQNNVFYQLNNYQWSMFLLFTFTKQFSGTRLPGRGKGGGKKKEWKGTELGKGGRWRSERWKGGREKWRDCRGRIEINIGLTRTHVSQIIRTVLCCSVYTTIMYTQTVKPSN